MSGNTTIKARSGASSSQELEVLKESAGTINKGQLVYEAGFHTQTNLVTVELAKANSVLTCPSIGFVDEPITNTISGGIITRGIISDINTSAWPRLTELYLSPITAGALTNIKPTGSNYVEKVAKVIRQDATEGCLEIYGGGIAIDSAGNIDGYTEKISVINTDLILIEDSEASNIKKKVQIGNLLTNADLGAIFGAKTIDIPLRFDTNSWFETKSTSYIVVDDFIFRGSTETGTPSALKLIAWSDGGVAWIRIYDFTNSTVIGEVSTTAANKEIIDLGTLSNIDINEAIWEVQIKRVGGSGNNKQYVSALQIQF